MTHFASSLAFLQEGGETGALMRRHDWARTRLGSPGGWPQSLKTAVSLMLRARQPVFIGWGPELLSLYNDGYIPICGIKHPHAFGKPMSEVWPEIWDTLAPLNEAVLRGESQWFENMPFNLAGRCHAGPSYFSFSYTPLLDDDGRVGGIFCSAVETTHSVLLMQRRAEEMHRLQRLFEQAPGFICTFRGPEHVFEFVNNAHRQLFRRHDIVGKPLREAFPDIEGQGIYERLDEVYRTGRRHVAHAVPMSFRESAGGPEQSLLLDFVLAPVLGDDGCISGIFCEGHDLTSLRSTQQALLEKEEQLRLATDAAEVGFWDVNLVTGTLYWPPRLRAMFGITSLEPVTLDDFFAGLHPEDLVATAAAFEAACDPVRRALYDVEYRTVGREDGQVRWVAAKGRGLFDADGHCVRVLGTAIDITARKAAELAMEVALAASRTGTFHWSIQDNRLSWDRALDSLFGLVPGQSVQNLEQFIALVHPDDRAGVVERCRRCRETAADFEMEFRVVHPDGAVRWLYDRGRTFVDARGRAKTMTGACVDVTERKEAESALRARERFYRQTLESMPGIMFTACADGTVDYLNEQWTAYTGVPVAEHLRDGWAAALHPADREGVVAAWAASMSTRKPFVAEARIRRHDGAYEWFMGQACIIPEADGMPARWIGSTHNIHDLKEAQAALQAREQELRTVADNSPDVIARYDPSLRHVFVNAAVETLMGLPAEAFLGRTSRELGLPEALCDQWDEAILQAFETQCPVTLQFEFAAQGNGPRHFGARLVPEVGNSGRVEHVLCVTRDITDAWLAQEALRRADRQKDEFLATLAHELRNPLAPLRTGLSVLQRTDGTPQQRRVCQIMERQLNHMVRLVDELLDIARISQGKIVLQREVLPLHLVLEHAVDACRPLLDAQGHRLSWKGVDPQWHVHGDMTRLVQVLSNLLCNAAKYTPRGGRVGLSAFEDGTQLGITVEDDGIGIPRDVLGRIFEPFVQVEQHLEHSQGGLGIGLSVVRSLVEMHGGRVAAHSAGPGTGSRFTIWLPRVQAPKPAAAMADPAAQGRGSARKTILIVDDNHDAAETLSMVVALKGHEAHVANDGAAALQLALRCQPQLVFLDLGMPGMNGFEVAAKLRALPGGADRLLVALTGWGSDEDRTRTLDAGFDMHLTKPVDLEAIEALLADGALTLLASSTGRSPA